MGEKLRYSDKELKEFEGIILEKLEKAKKELDYIKASISRKDDQGSDNSSKNVNDMDDSAEATEKVKINEAKVEAMSKVQSLVVILTSVSFIIAGILLSWLMSRMISAPLSKATEMAERIGRGNSSDY